MKGKTVFYYGVASLVSVMWAVTYAVCLFRNREPSPLVHSLMIMVVGHFFARAKAGPYVEKRMSEIEQETKAEE